MEKGIYIFHITHNIFYKNPLSFGLFCWITNTKYRSQYVGNIDIQQSALIRNDSATALSILTIKTESNLIGYSALLVKIVDMQLL